MSARDMFDLVEYTTDDWGAEADYNPDSHGGERPGNDQVFVHHPGFNIREAADAGNVNSEKAQIRAIEKNAMLGVWWGIPYDLIIGQSGTIYAGRGLARSGATSGDVDQDGTHNNDEGEAVCVLVSPETEMTEACKDSLKRVLDAHGGDVYGHQEAKGTATSCPGDDRMLFLIAYRNGELEDTETDTETDTDTDSGGTESGHWTEDVMAKLEMLKKGSRGVQVEKVQALLTATGQHSLRRDGIFGPLTERAVYEYQSDRRLMVDGIVGPQTWTSLLTRP